MLFLIKTIRHITLLLIITLMAVDVQLYAGELPDSPSQIAGTVGLWHFNNDALDTGGLGNNGTLVNGATFNAGGIYNQALSLDGADDHVTANGDALGLSTALTVEVWFKRTASDTQGVIIRNNQFTIQYATSNILGYVRIGTSWISTGFFSHLPPAGVWTHYALVWNGSTVTLYENGVSSTPTNASGTLSWATADHTLYFGKYSGAPVSGWHAQGLIDEVAIYNVALDAATILAHYKAAQPPENITDLSGSYSSPDYTLNWTAPDDNGNAITGYEIYYSTDGFATAGTLIADTDGDALDASAIVDGSGIPGASIVSFKVLATNVNGTATDSNIADVYFTPDPIDDLVVIYTVSPSEFTLSWTAPPDNGNAITGYEIYYSKDNPSPSTLVADVDGNALDSSALVNSIPMGPGIYYFKVMAVNSVGTAPDSNIAIISFVAPDDIADLRAVPGYDDSQTTLVWTAPADNGEPITDYIVEYDTGSGWQIFNDGVSSTPGATVTGLSNSIPGSAVLFQVTTFNQYLLSGVSNTAHGFPFPGESVVWVFADGTYATGNLSGNKEAESSKSIFQDGGVEANISSKYTPPGCWYSGCSGTYTSSYVGLSPPDYDQQIPKYAMRSQNTSTARVFAYVDGVNVKTINGSGKVRVERVGTDIHFVLNDMVQHTVDISAAGIAELVADGYAAGSVTNAVIYGVGPQAPTSILGFRSSPGYGDGEVGLIWDPPYENDDPITDYIVEYDVGSGWQAFVHAPITTPEITVTGLTNTVPGTAVWFRVAAVNGSGNSPYSSSAHGFPFPAQDVEWWYAPSSTITDNTINLGDAESSKLIAQDGGIEAALTSRAIPPGCWYSGCNTSYDPSYVGLSPQDYDQQIPKYAMRSRIGTVPTDYYAMVNGSVVQSINNATGLVRVERVGTQIKFVVGDVVYHTEDISAEPYTDLVADGYASGYNVSGSGYVSNAKIFGAHAQAPADVLDLLAKPAVGDSQVGLEWTIPPANDDPITDFLVEYQVDRVGSWFTFPHTPIVPGPGDTVASITVTGLNNSIPGLADNFRISAVNSKGVSNPSNVVYGFPFPPQDVTWINLTGSATDSGSGTLSGEGEGESFQYIEWDGGVEATVLSKGTPPGCWYSGCHTSYTPSYIGLSPQDYDQQIPKYAIRGKTGSFSPNNKYYAMVDGVVVYTINDTGVARVERVGTQIKFVVNDKIYYSEDISAEPYTILIADGYSSGYGYAGTGRVQNAKVYGAEMPVIADSFNAVEPASHNHDPASNDPVDGMIHTKVVGDDIILNIAALKDSNGDNIPDAVETSYATKIDRTVRITLGTLTNPTDCGTFTAWTPTTEVWDDSLAIPAYVPVDWATTGIEMVFKNADDGQKELKFRILNTARQNITVRMQDEVTTGCSSDTFTLRPDRYTLFVGHNGAPDNDAAGAIDLNNNTSGAGETHKAGTPVRLIIEALDANGMVTQNFDKTVTLIETNGDPVMDTAAGAGPFFDVDMDDSLSAVINQIPLTNGAVQSDDATYTEVGWINLTIENDDEYAAGDRDANSGAGDGSNADDLEITGVSIPVGRFTPDHFTFDNDGNMVINVTEGTNTFTYIGQPFTVEINNVDIEARNANGVLAQNYTGVFWKLGDVTDTTTDATVGAVDTNAIPITLAMSPGTGFSHLPATTAATANGKVTIDYAPVVFNFVRPVPPAYAVPINAPAINLTISGIEDSDNIQLIGGTNQVVIPPITTAPQLYGRVVLQTDTGSNGPETQAHTLTVVLENYSNAGTWVTNAQDICGGNCPGGAGNGFDINNVVLNGGAPGVATTAVGGGTTTASMPLWAGPTNTLTFTAPGAGNTGTITVTTNLVAPNPNPLPWLFFDQPSPSANVCFGCTSLSTNIMYQREPLR